MQVAAVGGRDSSLPGLVAGCWGWLLPTGCGFFFLVGGSDLQDVVFGGFGWTLEINNKGRLKNNILIK